MTEQLDTKKKERSPEYPAFDLEEAVNKARLLYQAERRNAAPMNAVLKHWGYSPKSGAGIRAVSTLEKFGLVISEGSGDNRKVRLSEAAFKILVDERPDSRDRLLLLQEAALKPTAHAELREKYPSALPSEDTLKFELRTRGFSEGASNDLIQEYRATLAFTKLDQSDRLTPRGGDKPPPPGEDAFNNTVYDVRNLQLPLSPTTSVSIQLPARMTEQAWKLMLGILEAMKPGVVAEPERERGKRIQLSAEAHEVLETVGKGGVPAYITPNLRKIAEEHSIVVGEQTTPNEIIEKLRALDD